MEIKILLLLHVLGATIWTGGHIILSSTFLPNALKRKDVNSIRFFENNYEKIGMPALLTQVITGLRLAYLYQPEISDWFSFSTPTNTHLGIKIILLISTLLLAIHARFFIIPKLNINYMNKLAAHIILVTVLSIAFVFVGINFRLAIVG